MTKESEKTIPFLRRLTDMLRENESIISFHPGARKKNGQTAIGRIVVHDRARVESEILPRYFNHASFASLRRQLNYFAFCRIGKGKQRGAIYCNDKVVELEDILRLKRRAVGSAIVPATTVSSGDARVPNAHTTATNTKDQGNNQHSHSKKKSPAKLNSAKKGKVLKASKLVVSRRMKKRSKKIVNSMVPVVHLPKCNNTNELTSSQCHHGPVPTHTISIISPSTPLSREDARENPISSIAQDISLDLTKSQKNRYAGDKLPMSNAIFKKGNLLANQTLVTTIHHGTDFSVIANSSMSAPKRAEANTKEADILAGCSALLSLGCQSA